MRGLYPIVDVDTLKQRGIAVLEFAERVLEARPPLLQLRAKHGTVRETLEWLRALGPLCARAGTRLIANDRPDLALLAAAGGVHIGQEDLPLSLVRVLASGLVVGVSTHDEAQLASALDERPDYVAFGPVFSTASKERAEPSVGVARLAAAYEKTRAAGIPLVAIGGVDLARAKELAPHCDLIAVIAALLPSAGGELAEVSARAKELHAVFGSN